MTYSAEVLADSPLVYWRLGEPSGTTAADGSGNGHTGTYTNTPTLGATGLLTGDANTAVSFNGASNEAVDGDDTPVAIGTLAAFSMECIFNIPGSGVGQLCTLADPASVAVDLIELWYDSGVVSFDFQGTAAYSPSASDSATGVHHLVGVFNGSTVKLYIDGVEADSQAFVNAGAVQTVANSFAAANYPGIGTVGATGVLDEVAFYTSALSAGRVAAHYAEMVSPTPDALPSAYPTLALSADLPTATDLTPYGEEPAFNIQRGLSSPMPTGMVADAGTLSTLLDNISRDLDPDNASGPFAGFLRPKVATAATATWGATTYELLTGRVDGWPQSYPYTGTDQVVEFRATDLFQFLANTPINTTRPPEKTSERIAAVLASIEYPGPTNIEPGLSTVCGQDLQTVAALSHLGDVAQVEYGEFGIAKSGVLHFRGRPAIATDVRSTVVQAEYVQSGGLHFVDVTRGALPLINHVTLTYGRNGRQVTVRDQDSIDDYDLQAASISLPFETYSQARGYGKWLLFLYSQPRTEFTSVTFEPYNEPGDTFDLWADVLSRKEGDLIQITLDPLVAPYTPAEDPIVEPCWIRGINYQFDQWPKRVSFAVQSTWIDDLFHWDTSELDGPDFYGL